jgi:hypothetical protein
MASSLCHTLVPLNLWAAVKQSYFNLLSSSKNNFKANLERENITSCKCNCAELIFGEQHNGIDQEKYTGNWLQGRYQGMQKLSSRTDPPVKRILIYTHLLKTLLCF